MQKQPDFMETSSDKEFVSWDSRYATGIGLIDKQHQELISLTNDLFRACLTDLEAKEAMFQQAMRRMVEYVNFHFGVEEALLARVNYPRLGEHKKLHEELIKSVLEAVKAYSEGKTMVANLFVRTLQDWIFGHIGMEDRRYADFIAEQVKNGSISKTAVLEM